MEMATHVVKYRAVSASEKHSDHRGTERRRAAQSSGKQTIATALQGHRNAEQIPTLRAASKYCGKKHEYVADFLLD
jgi:hypothetical protein